MSKSRGISRDTCATVIKGRVTFDDGWPLNYSPGSVPWLHMVIQADEEKMFELYE